MEKQLNKAKELQIQVEMLSIIEPDFKEGAEIMENLISALEEENWEKYLDYADKFGIYLFNFLEKHSELYSEETKKRIIGKLPAVMVSTQNLRNMI